MERDPFAAIADPTRRAIIGLLKAQPKSINQLAEAFPDLSRQAVVKHIRYLEDCGLLRIKQKGRERICNLYLQSLAVVDAWVNEYEEFWQGRMGNLEKFLRVIPEGLH